MRIFYIILIIFFFSSCFSKNEIKNNDVELVEFKFNGNLWHLDLQYEADFDELEYIKFDLNKMRKTDISLINAGINYYMLTDDDTGLRLTSNEFSSEYVKFNINSGELSGKFVFRKDMMSAIDFIEVLVDGRKQPVFNTKIQDYIAFSSSPDRNYFYIHEVTEKHNKFFIRMEWRRIGKEGIFWWGGDGPEGPREKNTRYLRGFYISSKRKTLDITYRVILPYQSLTKRNLADLNYENKNYTKEYKIRINLEDFFKSDSFRLGRTDLQE